METILTSGALEVIDFNLSKLYVALKINFKHKTNFISGEPKQVDNDNGEGINSSSLFESKFRHQSFQDNCKYKVKTIKLCTYAFVGNCGFVYQN